MLSQIVDDIENCDIYADSKFYEDLKTLFAQGENITQDSAQEFFDEYKTNLSCITQYQIKKYYDNAFVVAKFGIISEMRVADEDSDASYTNQTTFSYDENGEAQIYQKTCKGIGSRT